MNSISFFPFTKTLISLLRILTLSILITSPISLANQTHSISTNPPSAYEILKSYNFPIGILPKGVIDYNLDPTSGKFAAFLNGNCGFSLQGSYQIYYKSTIKGNLSRGKLTSLEGVSVKLFFFWVDIKEVERYGDNLNFYVGFLSAGFGIENFEVCPQCGCGVRCNNLSLFSSN